MNEKQSLCEIAQVLETSNELIPIIAGFDYSNLSERDVESIQCDLYTNEKDRTKKRLLISKDAHRYSGQPEPLADTLSQNLLLIRNKRNNKARLVPFQPCTLLSLNTIKRKSILPNLEQSYDESVKRLSQVFGSKRSQRMTELNYKMNMEGTVSEAVIEKVDDMEVTELDISNKMENAVESIMELVPPCNRQATLVEKVYEIENLLSLTELKSIEPTARFYIENPETDSDCKDFFLYAQYKSLGADPPLSKVQLLLYGKAMVNFINMSAHEIKAKSAAKNICPYSVLIGNQILNNCTLSSEHSRTRPVHLKDKAVCYLIVTMLLINNYQLPLDILTSAIKGYGLKKLQQLIKLVGLSPSTKGSLGGKHYILKLPLPPLPVVNAARKLRNK